LKQNDSGRSSKKVIISTVGTSNLLLAIARNKLPRLMSPDCEMNAKPRFVLFDWGDTLMSEAGPTDVPMADWPEVSCIDGAHDVLAQLSRIYSISIATNATVSTRRDILRALERAGLKQFVREVFCFTELGYRKSEPEFWDAVLTRLDAHRAEVVMIGDSVEQDVLGPMHAGIRAIWLNWKQENFTGTASFQSVRSLREFPAVIEPG
jgi:putative hydrolase of the HAD superfamily